MRLTASLVRSLGATAVLVAACNQLPGAQGAQRTPGDPVVAPAVARGDAAGGGCERADGPFVEGETCIRTADCPRVARCLDGRCQLAARSLQAEVVTERAARALAANRFAEAVEAFRAAEGVYHARSAPVPSRVVCGLARALSGVVDRGAAGGDREGAARALAQCLAAAPPGSDLAEQAAQALAVLGERGLDVAALDRPNAPLMTGRDPRPAGDNTNARLTFTGQGEGSRAVLRELVVSEATRREVVRCYLQGWESSRQGGDQGTLRVTYSRALDDYEEPLPPRIVVTPVDLPAAASDAGGAVHWLQCAAQAIQAAAATQRWPGRVERWAESIVVSVGP